MIRPPRPRRTGAVAWGALLLIALVGGLPGGGALAATPPAPGPEALGPTGPVRAEIGLPAPVRYAILLKEPEQVRTLYTRGDILFHPQDPARSWTVERVEAGGLLLRQGPRGRMQALRSGSPPLPGLSGVTFAGTVILKELHYRYKAVDRISHTEPVLVALEGGRAILEIEVLRSPRLVPAGSAEEGVASAVADAGASGAAALLPAKAIPPARATLDEDLLEKVQVHELGRERYEVNATDVQAVLDNAGRVLADLAPLVLPSISLQTGLGYRITSAAGDGVLSRQGFTVTAPKLAARVGLQVGDTILSFNGQPVDGFASLYRIFQEVRRDPALHTIQVELERQGTRLTHTYRIR